MRLYSLFLTIIGIFFASFGAADELPKLRVAVLQIGTVNWELDTIKRLKLDKANGFELVVQGYAGNDASRIAFQGGEADVVVADWIWTARQRADGKDFSTFPYSTAVGGIVVPADSPIKSLADFAHTDPKGAKIGIAGGPLDKSWLILRAYAAQEYGFDLAAATEQVYGAPPLIFKSALSGELDAAINFWHFLAKMKSSGMRQIVSVAEAAETLGLDPETPLLGYVFKDEFVAENLSTVEGFYKASRSAKAILLKDDAAWEPLRDRMKARSDTQFMTLRDDWRAGIPNDGAVNKEAANAMLSVMASLGGAKLVGAATTLPEGTFLTLE